jgi:hypothetical protein
MKRFLVFAGEYYYPGGGAYDYLGGYDTRESAVERAKEELEDEYTDWAHVLDVDTEEFIKVQDE